MPLKNGRLTPRERALVPAFVATGSVKAAAKAAGYANADAAGHALARPAIRGEVVRQQLERLENDILPLAVDALKSLLTDKAVPHGARATAVKIALDRVLGSKDAGQGKEPHEMTADELAQEIDRLRSIKADKARPVLEAEPSEDPGVFA